jgi:hypothetical protein
MSNAKGVTSRRTRSGIQILRVHYTADPERDSAWAQSERHKYSSQAAWDREQEIIHQAGGGELVFAEILNRYAHKIIIRDPNFQIPPFWKRIAGFDHGKTNPTAALVATVDCDGTIYCLSEYYQPGLTPHQHMENLRNLPSFMEARPICADPSIFYRTQAQSDGDFKSIADLYREAGLSGLWEGQNAELAGIERILEHWRDLDHREPTLKIICPYDYSRKRFGLFPDGCPNLLWELMRTRREQLTASQLMRKNPSEAIVDKDNHLRDALKYILLSLPAPSEKPIRLTQEEVIKEAFASGNYATIAVQVARFEAARKAQLEPVLYRSRWPPTEFRD